MQILNTAIITGDTEHYQRQGMLDNCKCRLVIWGHFQSEQRDAPFPVPQGLGV